MNIGKSIIGTVIGLFFFISGCFTGSGNFVIQPGSVVLVDYTCRLKTGEIAATTDKKIAENSLIPKAILFMPRQTYEPAGLVAGHYTKLPNSNNLKGFEEALEASLSEVVIGMKAGQTLDIKLPGGHPETITKGNNFLQMAKVRTRPKFIKMSIDEFIAATGNKPATGMAYVPDPAVPGRVVKFDENEVSIEFSARSGQKVNTPLGPGIIKAEKDHYLIEILAQKGDLVRFGAYAGRIVDVNPRMITIDFGHPFGGEGLDCRIKVKSVESRTPEKRTY